MCRARARQRLTLARHVPAQGQAPDGRKWTLGRHWLPRRKRFKKADIGDIGRDFSLDFGGDDLGILGVIVAVIVGVILAAFLALLLFNVFALALEL